VPDRAAAAEVLEADGYLPGAPANIGYPVSGTGAVRREACQGPGARIAAELAP
jgi:hypothetical protein